VALSVGSVLFEYLGSSAFVGDEALDDSDDEYSFVLVVDDVESSSVCTANGTILNCGLDTSMDDMVVFKW
jgi:hypothetical protein